MAVVVDTEGLSFDDVLIQPRRSLLKSRADADLSTQLTDNLPRLRIPIVSANMQSVTEHWMANEMAHQGGLGFLHRFMSIEENLMQFTRATMGDTDNGLTMMPVGVSIGTGKDERERFERLYGRGARIFLIDVAHAHSDPVLRFIDELDVPEDVALIVGNVATRQAVLDLERVGADAIKVGIGPGAACTTREVTGAGRAQLTAIMECAEQATVPIIADGGIRNSGDIVKALAAGADTVMLGRLLAGCDESPVPGSYWGNASARMNGHHAPEGTEGNVALTGSLKDTLKPLLWGLRSGISYAGAEGVDDLAAMARFERTAVGVAAESGTRV